MHLLAMSHSAARAVPSSHAKGPPLFPLAAPSDGARALSGVLPHRWLSPPVRGHLSWTLLAASNQASDSGEFICTRNQQLDAKLRLFLHASASFHVLPFFLCRIESG